MTAAHVVDGARTISLQTDQGSLLEGVAVGSDPAHDVALIRLRQPTSAKPLTLRTTLPARGSELAVLGYPFGVERQRITRGLMTGLPDAVDYGDQRVERAFTTDAATNGGNSGGPAIDSSGSVIGLVSGGLNWQGDDPAQGTNYLIPGGDLMNALTRWRHLTKDIAAACEADGLTDPEPFEPLDIPVDITTDDPWAPAAAQVLHSYGLAISQGSYEAAYNSLSPDMQVYVGGLEKFSSGLRTSFWDHLTINAVRLEPDSSLTAQATLRTTQDAAWGPKGHTCSIFDLEYTLVPSPRGFLIDKALGTEQACP